MKVLIIEDEQLAAERMQDLLVQYDSNILILAIIDSIKNAVKWLKENSSPDLIFMDIQITDGLSFEIFEKVRIESPVIFTTAYEEYAVKAFKVNSIDYLLKPIDQDELISAITKFRRQYQSNTVSSYIQADLLDSVRQMLIRQYKSRFVLKISEHIKSISVTDILYFYSYILYFSR